MFKLLRDAQLKLLRSSMFTKVDIMKGFFQGLPEDKS